MTFSDSRIVKLLQDEFIPVWESVSPVREVTFDLGEGRSVSGTVGGEIAIYFCTPDGYVFDILPALQSPGATKQAMEQALAFYEKSMDTLKSAVNEQVSNQTTYHPKINTHPMVHLVAAWHRQRMSKHVIDMYNSDPEKFESLLGPVVKEQKTAEKHTPRIIESIPTITESATITGAGVHQLDQEIVSRFKAEELYPQARTGEEARDKYVSAAMDEATRDMRVMALSKVAMATPAQPITVVEPGGRGYFMWQVHRAFLGVSPPNAGPYLLGSPVSPALRKPSEWKETLFVNILKQPLEGGKVTYDSESLKAISIIEE